MDAKELLSEILSQLSSSSFEEFKRSLKTTLHCILGQLQNVDTVVELMQKSSDDCLEMTETILKDIPRLDLVHKLQAQADFSLKNKETMDILRVILETLKDLTHTELNKFTSALEIELAHIWKQRLDHADLSQVIQLMVTVFSQDPVVLTKRVLLKMGLINKRSYLTPSTEGTSDAQMLIRKTLTQGEFTQFKHHLEIYLPHISVRLLETAYMENIVALMERNSYYNCVEMTEKVFKRMERPDLLNLSSWSRPEEHSGRRIVAQGPNIETSDFFEMYKRKTNTRKKKRKKETSEYTIHLSKPFARKDQTYKQWNKGILKMLPGRRIVPQGPTIETSEYTKNLSKPFVRKVIRIKTSGFTHNTTLLLAKSGAMQSAIQSLLKTLSGLSNVELQRFNKKVGLKSPPSVEMDPEQTVFWIILQYGQQFVQKVTDVFVDMGLTKKAQRLMDSCSEPVRNVPLWHWLSWVPVVKDLLLDTAHSLSHRELMHFQWFVQFTFFEMGFSWIHLDWERQTQEFKIIGSPSPPLTAKEACTAMISAVVAKHGVQSVSVMEAVLRNMKRYDLANSLADIFRLVELSCTQWPAPKELTTKSIMVEQMMAVITLLMETLGHLNVKELTDLKHTLKTGPYHAIMWYGLSRVEISQMVFCIVQTYGLKSVEIIKNLLGSIGRTDLEQILFKDMSNEHSSEFWLTELIHKVAKMAVVNEQFKETLIQMSCEELKLFKKLFLLKNISHKASLMDLRLWAITNAAETGTLLLHIYGLEVVEMTYWILMDMNRSDLAQQLWPCIFLFSGKVPKEKVAAVEDLRGTLYRVLSHVEIDTFKWMLQVTYFRFGLEWIPETVLQGECDEEDLADLILETSGQKSVDVIKDVLHHMNRTDLLKSVTYIRDTDDDWSSDSNGAHVDLRSLSQVTADTEKVLDVLQELTDCSEMQSLEEHLRTLCENNLSRRFVKNYRRMYPGMNDLVELIKSVYGESRCVKMIKAVLVEMGRCDLAEKMSKPCSTSAASTEGVEPKSCTNAVDIWTKLHPEVNKTDRDKQSTYRLQSDAGSYECSVSGLRWRCEEKVSFQYKFGSWEEYMERVEAMQYMPAGPLIDLTVSSGRLDVVYLPHWICIDSKTKKNLAVLHVDDCGDAVEKVAEVTSSHVKLCEPIFSPRAVLIKLGVPVKIYCSVLIYKTNTAFLTLHVYLIPCDPGLEESMDRQEQEYGYSIIRKPHPDKSMKVRDRFLLTTDIKTVEITPEKLTLRYKKRPNFFEVYSRNPDFDFILELKTEAEHVLKWSCTIRQDDYIERADASNAQGSHFVDRFRAELIQRVTNTAEILDHMLHKKIINQEIYEKIMNSDTTQNKMRELYNGPLKSSGEKGKDVFYQILKRKEKHLCAELENIHIK